MLTVLRKNCSKILYRYRHNQQFRVYEQPEHLSVANQYWTKLKWICRIGRILYESIFSVFIVMLIPKEVPDNLFERRVGQR